MDHSQCEITTTPQWERHTCPPCSHGLLRGGEHDLTGRPETDAMQRVLKLREIEQYRCGSAQHDEVLSKRAGVEADG